MSEDTLQLWQTLRLPSTCQTQTDIDEDTGELLVDILGIGPSPDPPPVPPTDKIAGIITDGLIGYQVKPARWILRYATIEPFE